ncbi:SDR family oxidoreductase [Streptomyces coffeae]|uniref:NAD(P)-dependent oxidoreductase n=1 Tax=Streptomyces coffeae TaxID=621382 RepID=A0ABS1NN33_9ACTN|nr:NAD(P)-dependent oxidoreductase [Streptomyces coffeae]MBL1101502.1 NAD(P)-dependent oxidoreductase [Streptomyces coffeae]
MSSQQPLAGRTVLMSGGSRGIGLAIAVRAARDGANIAFISKTDNPDPRLPGTVHTAAAEIEAAGGQALPIVGDIRDDDTVNDAVARTVARFGGIDILVNNASAIALTGIGELPLKRYDLIQDINARGTFVLTTAALPYLLKSSAPRVLTLSPPLNLDRRWLARHAPYTVSKYAMTMLTLGVAEQYRDQRIAACCLWPRTLVATAAVQNVVGGDGGMRASRRPGIMADAAAVILALPASEANGQCYVDEDVLRAAGVREFSRYLHDGATEDGLETDLFL